ncbi:sirohydrochlorin cobaltochelatase [Halosquirtibacter laminarini]|uniref:Sirohydrochlorin cobaltochelatase n=1 Tax=Halosquirtibacter laminarini TaxID=3374600 RepID=A0AC61ND09_9BACT|nr:sirohydrochlorin cobaltochelatase [Prolixibacteraceae bacterium]
MKNFFKNALLLALLTGLFASCSKDDDMVPTKKTNDKTAILLVTFGSSYTGPEKSFANIEEEVKKAYPNDDISWAFTSHIIRNKLIKNGVGPFKDIDSPEEAMKKLKESGYKKIVVQSLHVIPGSEFNDLKKKVEEFRSNNPTIKMPLGTPLMNTDDDMKQLCDIMVKKFAKEDQTVVMMGHGTKHEANDRYTRVGKFFKDKDKNFIVGTVEATPGITEVIADAKQLVSKNILLMPLMSVAGDHATNDMAADFDPKKDKVEDKSWKVLLQEEGYKVTPLMKGLADYDEVVSLWLEHLATAKKEL